MLLTENERLKRCEDISKHVKELYPNVIIENNKYDKMCIVHYIPKYLDGKIEVTKNLIEIRPSAHTIEDFVTRLQNKYLTKKEAIDQITKVLPIATNKFDEFVNAYRKICKEHDTSISFNYESYDPIYDEYYYCRFNVNGFDFKFEMREYD